MWSKTKNPRQPRDIAYVLEALIVEYYYTHATDLDSAVHEILSVTDYQEFIGKSRYDNKFND